MKRKNVLALIGLLCALALALPAALAEEDALFLPEDLGADEVQAGELTIDDPALIDGLVDGDVLSMPEALDLGELWSDDVTEVPAAQETVETNDGEDFWNQEQFEAWYEGEKTAASSADHLLGPDGDLLNNYLTVIFPGETIAVVPDAEISDSAYTKYGYMIFNFTVYQMDAPKVIPEYNGVNLLPRTGTPAKTTLKAVKTEKLNVPYRVASTFSGVADGSIIDYEYVSLYKNDTGLPIIMMNEFGNTEEVGRINGQGENNLGSTVLQGRGYLTNQPTLYFLENYYEINYNYGDVPQSELFFPADAPTQYADRIYIDKEEHTYRMPRPTRKGYLFNEWDGWGSWYWDYLPSHMYPTRISERTGSIATMTDNAYTYTMNFDKYVRETGSNAFYALRDGTVLDAKFIEPGYPYPSCVTVGFNAQGGTVNGQKSLLCEVCLVSSQEFDLDIGKIKAVREGYTFKGWCTDPKDEAGTLIKDTKPENASAWAQDAHTELYAVWQSNTPTTISLSKAKVAAIKAQTYTGKAIKPTVTVTLSGKTLKKGTDYTVAYKNNTNAGMATVTVTGKGDYTGSVTASFKINPASLAKAKVAAIKAQTYTGKAIKPTVKVKLAGKTLKKGTDYTVAYKNNKAIGKAAVTIKGKGNYTGSVSKTFAINPKAVSLASLTAGKGKLTVKWKKGTGDTGYQLEYSLKKSFASSTKVKITKTATVSRVLKNLKSGKTYYVRIRGYKLVGGKAYVSAWSKALNKKVN